MKDKKIDGGWDLLDKKYTETKHYFS